ncbi:cardiomyopathy-associated protein 5-like [Galendromus occidentalis]|uniref:Cardiomyopathy-associated protein 5-like n=1 Tax=Galendromus occidentalis TaxID=34638 RepID=A0AAJ6QSR7_9ACAR|nr:cardiomyopathy-associated protein 5-like [Galendromus occidentalis]
MKSFSASCVILFVCASAAQAGHLGRAHSYAPIHHQQHAQVSSAPHHGHSVSTHYAAAPVVAVAAAVAHKENPHVAAAPAPAPQPRLHEIHTSSGRQFIRIEEYARPNQLIRVHEQEQAAPEIIRVQAPAENPALIRVIAKSSGPAHIERIVHRAPSPQIINVHKPAPPPARIVQVVRGPAAAPRIEFHYEESPAHEVHIAEAPADVPLPAPVPHVSLSPQPITVNLPDNGHVQHAPVKVTTHTFAAPANYAPHRIHTRVIESSHAPVHAQPYITVSAAPAPSQKQAPAQQGWSANELPSPPPHPRPIGTVYDAGDHIKIIKKSQY